jgi:predicted RNA-binding Zn ribbon-like protein
MTSSGSSLSAMSTNHSPAASYAREILLLGDDIALDFINTAYGVGKGARECLRSDADVLHWLDRVALPAQVSPQKPGELLRLALELRQIALELVEKRSAGRVGNPERLNRLLEAGSSYSELSWPRGGVPALSARQRLRGVEGLLLPVAQALARLLSGADFHHVRKCEGPECTLWFLDRTKAHSRRWCSPALCGNRAKVAAFRDRSKRTES